MNRSKLLASLVPLFLLAACDRDSCDREAPVIKYVDHDYAVYQLDDSLFIDSLVIEIRFEDCQGDIGIKSNESGFNLHTFQYDKINGEWSLVVPDIEGIGDTNSTSAFFAKVPHSPKTNEGNRLEGTIEQRFGSLKYQSDTIRFEMQLIDRAGNKSNRITTEAILLEDY